MKSAFAPDIFFGRTEIQTEIEAACNQFEYDEKEVEVMPTLKHLIEELQKLEVDPDEVWLPGTLYDDLVEQAEDATEDEEEEE